MFLSIRGAWMSNNNEAIIPMSFYDKVRAYEISPGREFYKFSLGEFYKFSHSENFISFQQVEELIKFCTAVRLAIHLLQTGRDRLSHGCKFERRPNVPRPQKYCASHQ